MGWTGDHHCLLVVSTITLLIFIFASSHRNPLKSEVEPSDQALIDDVHVLLLVRVEHALDAAEDTQANEGVFVVHHLHHVQVALVVRVLRIRTRLYQVPTLKLQ